MANAAAASGGATRVLLGVLGTIVLGAIGSGLWELIFRPELGRISNLVTSISTFADRSVYTGAALDPTPVPGLILLLVLVLLPALMGMWFLHRGFLRPLVRSNIEKKIARYEEEAQLSSAEPGYVEKKINTNIRWLAGGGAVYCLLIFVFIFYALLIENKAIVVWRVFNQNIEILAPFVDAKQISILRSHFRSMKDRRDFEAIYRSMNAVASSHGVTLEWHDAL